MLIDCELEYTGEDIVAKVYISADVLHCWIEPEWKPLFKMQQWTVERIKNFIKFFSS